MPAETLPPPRKPFKVIPNHDDQVTGERLFELEIGQMSDRGYAVSKDGVLLIRTASNTQLGAIVNGFQMLFGLTINDGVSWKDIIDYWNAQVERTLEARDIDLRVEAVSLVRR